MYTTCIDRVDQNVTNPWAVEACVLGATCFGGKRPVDDFLASVYSYKNPNSSAYPAWRTEPRLPASLLNAISTDGKTRTQQNFVSHALSNPTLLKS
jgi:Fe-S-cluster-containing dehydrogenase component